MNNEKIVKGSKDLYCEKCDYLTYKKFNFAKHLKTNKHKLISGDNKKVEKHYSCACGKTYKYASGLSAHKKKCKPDIIIEEKVDISFKEMFLEMVSQNKELQKTIIEQTKTIQEMIPKIGNNNLTLLNTDCKDIFTLNKFIESTEAGIKDFVYTSEKGFADGITNLCI